MKLVSILFVIWAQEQKHLEKIKDLKTTNVIIEDEKQCLVMNQQSKETKFTVENRKLQLQSKAF